MRQIPYLLCAENTRFRWVAISLTMYAQMLGHTSIKSTIVYTHLIEPTESDEYVSRAARSIAGARALIEAGFQYVCEMDTLKLFRKRK